MIKLYSKASTCKAFSGRYCISGSPPIGFRIGFFGPKLLFLSYWKL